MYWVEGLVYVSPSSALDAWTGNLLWSYDLTSGGVWDPRVSEDAMYFFVNTHGDFSLKALDALTGEPLWSYGPPTGPHRLFSPGPDAPYIAAGAVYVWASSGLAALDALTRERLWSHEAQGSSRWFGVSDGVVYVWSNLAARLRALDASTGEQLWWHKTSDRPTMVSGGIIYIDVQYALDASTGEALSSYKPNSDTRVSVVVDGIGYGVTQDPSTGRDYQLVALDAMTGELLWRFDASGHRIGLFSVVDGIVYVQGFFSLYALDSLTGEMLWHFENRPSSWTSGDNLWHSHPVDGVVYVGAYDGYVYALDALTGELLWRYLTGGKVNSSPVVAGGVVYVESSDGYVYAIVPSTAEPSR